MGFTIKCPTCLSEFSITDNKIHCCGLNSNVDINRVWIRPRGFTITCPNCPREWSFWENDFAMERLKQERIKK